MPITLGKLFNLEDDIASDLESALSVSSTSCKIKYYYNANGTVEKIEVKNVSDTIKLAEVLYTYNVKSMILTVVYKIYNEEKQDELFTITDTYNYLVNNKLDYINRSVVKS